MKRRLCLLGLLGLLAAAVASAAPSPAEQQMIDALIARVATMPDVRFVRNGRDYDARDAARFLREKYKARGQDVDTAEAFIERIASKSSTSGQPYLIRQADGREQPVAEVLRAELVRLRAQR